MIRVKCFICWQMESSLENLIVPCSCRDVDLRYVHRHCINKWLSISSHNRFNTKKCNVCGQVYRVKILKYRLWDYWLTKIFIAISFIVTFAAYYCYQSVLSIDAIVSIAVVYSQACVVAICILFDESDIVNVLDVKEGMVLMND
jgi:hypothetical protein